LFSVSTVTLFLLSFVSSFGAGELGATAGRYDVPPLPGICDIVPELESGVEPPHSKKKSRS
jgi:hypothetical protein